MIVLMNTVPMECHRNESNKPPRRPVFVSHEKPKVNVVAIVYSCFFNSSCVVFFLACVTLCCSFAYVANQLFN